MTRLPNYYAPEQVRIDDYVVSFMPFVQKDLLKYLFILTNSARKNGILFRDLIKKNSPQLTKTPLVKGSITHPFNSSSLNARLNARVKQKFGLNYKSKIHDELFFRLREYIFDMLNSTTVINCDLYDKSKIKTLRNKLESDQNGYSTELDWFLSFELFGQGITN